MVFSSATNIQAWYALYNIEYKQTNIAIRQYYRNAKRLPFAYFHQGRLTQMIHANESAIKF